MLESKQKVWTRPRIIDTAKKNMPVPDPFRGTAKAGLAAEAVYYPEDLASSDQTKQRSNGEACSGGTLPHS